MKKFTFENLYDKKIFELEKIIEKKKEQLYIIHRQKVQLISNILFLQDTINTALNEEKNEENERL